VALVACSRSPRQGSNTALRLCLARSKRYRSRGLITFASRESKLKETEEPNLFSKPAACINSIVQRIAS
jgi:hypothetical protein